MIININANLYQLEVGGTHNIPVKTLSPDVEIKLDNGYYATLGRTHHGLQYDGKENEKVMNKCSEIATKLFELYDILKEEKDKNGN